MSLQSRLLFQWTVAVLFDTTDQPQYSKIESSPLTAEEFEILREMKEQECQDAFLAASNKFGW